MPGDKGAGSQILNQRSIDTWGCQEVKLGQGFAAIAARERQTTYQVLLTTTFQFIIQQQGQEFNWAQLTFSRLVSAQIEGFQHPREL
jgi:hypothetical protein